MNMYKTVNVNDLKPAYDDFYGVFTRRVLLQDDVLRYRNVTKRDDLPSWDQFGYEIAYFVAKTDQTTTYTENYDGTVTENTMIDIDEQGEPLVREMTGDGLCGHCAGFARDDAYYIVYQINGEIGDEESVYCSDCGEVIYKSWKDEEAERLAAQAEDSEDEENKDEWLVGEER